LSTGTGGTTGERCGGNHRKEDEGKGFHC
jgi:hypothetical protein